MRITPFLILTAIVPGLCLAAPNDPDTTEATGQGFAERTPANLLRVLIVGSGTSHDFPKFFLGTDKETLIGAGGMDIAATPNLDEALALLPVADVVVFSGNHDQYGKPEFQKALNDFADKGKGLVFLHAATWKHPQWIGYNKRFINGMTPSHGKGNFEVTVKDPESPLMKGVPATFTIFDENYRFEPGPEANYHLCAENSPDGGEKPNPSIWTVKDPKTRIVCITLGHDGRAHDNPAYRTILVNSVKWVANRQ